MIFSGKCRLFVFSWIRLLMVFANRSFHPSRQWGRANTERWRTINIPTRFDRRHTVPQRWQIHGLIQPERDQLIWISEEFYLKALIKFTRGASRANWAPLCARGENALLKDCVRSAQDGFSFAVYPRWSTGPHHSRRKCLKLIDSKQK